ncbi:unnamed protein product [Musa acuminata var. zebrina]
MTRHEFPVCLLLPSNSLPPFLDHYLAALIGRCFAELKKDSLHAMIRKRLNGGDVKGRLNRSTSSDHRIEFSTGSCRI